MAGAHLPHLLDASMFWGTSGGVRRVLSTKHVRLPALGWRHSVLAPGVDDESPGFIDCGGVPLPASGGYRVVLGRAAAARLIERAAPDLVEAADPYVLAWAALDAARRLQVPAVAFCHSHLPALVRRYLGRWAARRARDYLVDLYQRFDLVLAPGDALADTLRRWGVPRVATQPLGVDTAVFHPQAANPVWRVRLARRLDLSPHAKLLVYSGRFATEKNLPLLVDALARLGPGHALICAGSGPRPPSGPGVFRMAPIADSRRLARLVASADCYVHAGDQETFGLGVLEAMACGTPVVVPARGGLGELAAGVGHRVHETGPAAWAETIRAALTEGRGARSARALVRAREHDWQPVLQQWSERYRLLVARHRASVPSLLPAGEAPPFAPLR